MQSTTTRPKSSSPPLHRKKINDEDCLSMSLASIQQIYGVCQFYSDFKIESSRVMVNSSSKFSKTISYSQVKKRQFVDKSISLYKKTKETYKHKRRQSLSSIMSNRDGEKTDFKEESASYFNTAKRLYSSYVSPSSAASFLMNHVPLKYSSGNELKPIEKTELKYKDASPLTDGEVVNMIRFLKDLSKIEVTGQPVGLLMKLFLTEWRKYYINFQISPNLYSSRKLSLNDMTPLEFMVNMEMWVHRYMNFIYSNIEYASNFYEEDAFNDSTIDGNSFENLKGSSDNSIYSADTAVQFSNRSLSAHSKSHLGSSSSTILSSRMTDVNSFSDDSTLFDGLELDLTHLDFSDINESCISPISEKIDILYPTKNNEETAKEINSHNHDHCLKMIKQRSLHYYELPFPYRENRFVINGYRYYNFADCLRSVFAFLPVLSKPTYHEAGSADEKRHCSENHIYQWHNETVNIWTHLLASFYFLYRLITFKCIYKTASQNAAISAFFLMSFCCFMLSSLWHTFSGWNKVKKRSKACCLDYSGISMLIISSIIAVQCSIVPADQKSYLQLYVWVGISLSLLTVSLILNWHPRFDSPESRNMRILVFVSMAAVGNISIITLNPAKKGFHFMMLFKNSFAWYLLGVVFYGGFLPERFRTDCPIGKIPTMLERSNELRLIREERSLYFKSNPYSAASILVSDAEAENKNEKILTNIDDNISDEIDSSSHSWNSLWWTDYYFQSHNIWHLMVIMGCFGHFKAVESILDNMN